MTRLLLTSAAAGAMGWGIRGQYGHETGAMIAGLLVSLVIVRGLRPQASAAWAMRAVAFGAIGVGFGGAMTYGQTLGLTQDAALVGRWDALRWGLLGVGLKGALWIGFLGAFLGMGLGGVRYRSRELLLLMIALVLAALVGVWLLNAPYDPANRLLPRLYFSAAWYWTPDAVDLKPRREVWGGLLVALAVLGTYVGLVRRDGFAVRLLGWGLAGGGAGFAIGQSIQAAHAWNRVWFATGPFAAIDPHVNWWNTMETTFGAVMGGTVALGAWVHRTRIASSIDEASSTDVTPVMSGDALSPAIEWIGLALHVGLLMTAEFTDVPVLGRYADVSLLMGVLPLALAAEGRWAPAMIALPVTLLPIAGKTVRRLVHEQHTLPFLAGWLAYFVLPVALMCGAAWWIARQRADAGEPGDGRAVRVALLLATWVYVGLNFAFFDYPWPWAVWTIRTLHALVFFACAIVVTAYAARTRARPSRS